MKINYPKSWFERHLVQEDEAEVGAGTPPIACSEASSNVVPLETRMAFGTFVGQWRRNKGWDAVTLAEQAGVDPEEILEIEHDPYSRPELDAVHKLAGVFGLPSKPLLELAGLIEFRTPDLRREGVRFAARSESVEALNAREREAFEAFVTVIAESSNK